MGLQIVGAGMAVPPDVETADDLARKINTTTSWIIEHTGVSRRHVAAPGADIAVLGAEACQIALDGRAPPDLIINASGAPRQTLPDSSVFLQRMLNLEGIACFSIHASCMSFLHALHAANAFLVSGNYRRILISSADMATRARNWKEPESAALLGDGAAAVVVEHVDGPPGLLDWRMATWPSGAELTEIRGGGVHRHPNDPDTRREDNMFHMEGKATYRFVRPHFLAMLKELLTANRLAPSDIDLVVPHQPSAGGLSLLQRVGFSSERVVNILPEYGNCCAASLPMALVSAIDQGRLSQGATVLLMGTGAGISVGLTLVRW